MLGALAATSAEAPSDRRYAFHGFGLRLTGAPRLLAALDTRLHPYATATSMAEDLRFELTSGDVHTIERPAGELRSVYDTPRGEIVYADATDELYLAIGDRVRARCQPASGLTSISACNPDAADVWLMSHAMLTLLLLEMLKRRGLYGIHAAGVSRRGRGILLPGTSGAGKTTLAVALARAGFDFLGDDTLFLAPAAAPPLVRAFHHEVDVTDTTAGFFAELAGLLAQPRPTGWPKWPLQAAELRGATPAWACLPVALVFPHITASATSSLEPMSAAAALLELLPNVLLTEPHACQEHLRVLGQLTTETPCYRLHTGRDFEALPALLGSLIT